MHPGMHPRGKVCVVTGAASGIGEAVARAYAEAGARGVVVANLNAERLAKVAGEIDAPAVPTDVSQESDIKALIAAAEARFGPVDVFYSNAGISRPGMEDASEADWDPQLAGACSQPRVRSARFGAGHVGARLGLSAEHGIGRGLADIDEFDGLRRDQERGCLTRRTFCDPVWRPWHQRLRSVPAVCTDGHDEWTARGGKRRWRHDCGGGRSYRDRCDGG